MIKTSVRLLASSKIDSVPLPPANGSDMGHCVCAYVRACVCVRMLLDSWEESFCVNITLEASQSSWAKQSGKERGVGQKTFSLP